MALHNLNRRACMARNDSWIEKRAKTPIEETYSTLPDQRDDGDNQVI